MLELYQQALYKADTGIIILDKDQKILFWNEKIENISKIPTQAIEQNRLPDVYEKFSDPRYQSIFESVLKSGQSRFCSSAIHKAFILPHNEKSTEHIRQNLRIDPLLVDGAPQFLMLQITDITDQVANEQCQRSLIQELQKGYQRIKASEAAIREKAKYDMLTGLLNRHMLETELKAALVSAQNEAKITALFFIDLDGFKKVNDQYGHLIGDVLLQQVAGRLKTNTRQAKDRAKDTIARIGGDEFLLWIHRTSKKDVATVAKRIVSAIGKPYFIDNYLIRISVSVGIALYPNDANTIKNLIKCSDKAMYHVKNTTKNNYCFYTA